MSDVNTSRELRLGRMFVRLADSLVTGFDVVEMLDALVISCVDLLDAGAAGLMLSDQRGQLRVMAASSEQTRLMELFELQYDQGPCVDCYRTGQPLRADSDQEQAERWPLFAVEVRSRGFGPLYALPLRLRDNTIGALNIFQLPGAPLPDGDLQIAQALADVATIAILQHRTIHAGEQLAEQLQTALNSRVAIEQAKGVLAEFAHVDMARAFEMLRHYSRNTQSRLSEVAAAIASGKLPPETVTALG
jgi:GAF domain-containing protein